MSEPLSDTRLTEIRALSAAATGGHWHLDPEGCFGPGTLLADTGPYEHLIGALDFGTGEQADADKAFVLNAHQDMAALLAEVNRLRAELADLRACDCYPNPNDHADRCPIFLAAQPEGGED